MEGTAEFEMMVNGNLEVFRANYEYVAWTDCYDIQDSRSEFWDWEYTLTSVEYDTAEGVTKELDMRIVEALRPEYKHLIDVRINNEIENEIG